MEDLHGIAMEILPYQYRKSYLGLASILEHPRHRIHGETRIWSTPEQNIWQYVSGCGRLYH
jgi:hypothetical protein